MQFARAYLRPEGRQSGMHTGQMTLLPSTQAHKYWSNKPYKTGLYDVQYTRTKQEVQGGHTTTIHRIESAEAQYPSELSTYRALVRDITGHSHKILSALPNKLTVEDMRQHLHETEWLETIPGIGPVTAQKLAAKFRRLSPENGKLYQVFREYSIPFRPESAAARWAVAYFNEYPDEIKTLQENPYYVLQIANRAYKKVRMVKADYPDLSIQGYTLEHVDEPLMDESPGVWAESKQRAVAYIDAAYKRIKSEGHTVATRSHIVTVMRQMGFSHYTSEKGYRTRVTESTIHDMVYSSGTLTGTRFIDARDQKTKPAYTSWTDFMNAQVTYRSLRDLSFQPLPYSDALRHRMITDTINSVPFEFDRYQKSAVEHAFTTCASAITGPAGSGKTTVIQAVLNGLSHLLYSDTYKDPVTEAVERRTAFNMYITAPTGKAVSRLKEGLTVPNQRGDEPFEAQSITTDAVTRDPDAPPTKFQEHGDVYIDTLHSLLGYNTIRYRIPSPHPCVIVIDEASMADAELIAELAYFVHLCIEADVPLFVLLTGDVEQLPPVGAGYPFRDILGGQNGPIVPSTRLQQVHRQGQGSAILHNVHRILGGKLPLDADEVKDTNDFKTDCFWYDFPDIGSDQRLDIWEEMTIAAENANQYTEGPEVYPEDVEVILPLRNPSSVSEAALCIRDVNRRVQEEIASLENRTLNEYLAQAESGATYMKRLSIGDRVLHTGPNGYSKKEIERGSRGVISDLPRDSEGIIHVTFDDGSVVPYKTPIQRSYIQLAYANTGHTAQGSQFDVVLVVVPRGGADPLLHRAWIYTACTRAERFLQLTATQRRLRQCVDTNTKTFRRTELSKYAAEM